MTQIIMPDRFEAQYLSLVWWEESLLLRHNGEIDDADKALRIAESWRDYDIARKNKSGYRRLNKGHKPKLEDKDAKFVREFVADLAKFMFGDDETEVSK